MDRPSRKTKVVSYCEAKDFDDDEDFACVKAPPSKKSRETVKQEHKKSSSKSCSQESNSQSTGSQKSRKPLGERLHDRDLEAAITLSMLNSAEEIKNQSSTNKDIRLQIPVDENTDPASLHRSNCSVDSTVLGLDEIISEKEPHSRQRKAATKAAAQPQITLTDEDEEYEPKLTSDSESDEDFSEPGESEEEEFTVKKVSKTKEKKKAPVAKKEKSKQTPVPKKEKPASKPSKSKLQAAASTPVRSPLTAKPAPKRPASSYSAPASKPASSLSPAGGRIPKWTPPGQIGRSSTSNQGSAVSSKSPAQGLRLGLSRLVRVKPLHPSVASH